MKRFALLLALLVFAAVPAMGQSVGVTASGPAWGATTPQAGLSASYPVLDRTLGVSAMGLYHKDRKSAFLAPTLYLLHHEETSTDVGVSVGAGRTWATERIPARKLEALERDRIEEVYYSGIAGFRVRDDAKSIFVGAQHDFASWNNDVRFTVGVSKAF